jgi:hypothetical protein
MSGPSDVARNHAAVRALADRLEREGWTGDAYVRCLPLSLRRAS